jgi:O-antigen/teichoic acid export membrane protein
MIDLLRKDRIATSVGVVLVLLLAQRVVSFTRGIIFARLLGTEQYGIYTLGFFLIFITVAITSLGIPACFGRYAPRYQDRKGLRWFFRKAYILNTLVSILVGVVVFFFPAVFARLIYGDPSHASVMMVVGVCIPGLVILTNLTRTFAGLKLFRASSVLDFSQVGVYAVVGILLVALLRSAVTGLLAYAVSMFVGIAIFMPLLSKYLLSQEPTYNRLDETGFYGRLLRFTIWFTVTPLLNHVFHYVDRLSLQRLMSTSDQGIYSASVNLSALISAVGLAVNNVIYPHLSTSWERGEHQKTFDDLDLAIRVTSVALIVVGVVLVLLAEPVILLLLGPDYVPGAQVLPLLVVFYLFTISVWLFGVYPTLIERTYVSAIGLAFALPANIVLNLRLIPRMGIIGAGLATMLSFFLMWLIVVLICRRFGLPTNRRMIVVSLFPFVLLLPKVGAVAAVALIAVLCLRTNLILEEIEKQKVYQELRSFTGRLGKPRKSP